MAGGRGAWRGETVHGGGTWCMARGHGEGTWCMARDVVHGEGRGEWRGDVVLQRSGLQTRDTKSGRGTRLGQRDE